MNGWTHVGTANGGNVYVKPLERRQYACADVDEDGKLPRNYRNIQWWAVPRNPVTNHPDMTCLLTLKTAIKAAIEVHLQYARALAELGDRLQSDPFRPQGVIHVTPDGYRELAWAWWDDHLEGHPIIRIVLHSNLKGESFKFAHHHLLPTDHPELIDNAINRVHEYLTKN